MFRRTLLALALSASLAGCASSQTAEPAAQAQRFAGVWDFHFETSSFRTTDGQGPFWLAAEGEGVWPALTEPFRATGNPWGQLDIEIEGTLSAPGRYGHLGAYERELHVTRVISSRLHQPTGS